MENNSDHWNALLISLRELAEWVIAEEAVLEAMGPIAGDEISIRRQQEAARSFSRQLEDKRAVIENNLQTGRQHLDSANIQAEEGKNILFSNKYTICVIINHGLKTDYYFKNIVETVSQNLQMG